MSQNDQGKAGPPDDDAPISREPLTAPAPEARKITTLVSPSSAMGTADPAPVKPAPQARRVATLQGGTPVAALRGSAPADPSAPKAAGVTTIMGGITPPSASPGTPAPPPVGATATLPSPVKPITIPPPGKPAPPGRTAPPPAMTATPRPSPGAAPKAAPSAPAAAAPRAPAASMVDDDAWETDDPATLAGQLRGRAKRLRTQDPVGAARALVELGLYHERVAEDRGAARAAYESARTLVRTLEPALGRIRRLLEGRGELAKALEILDDELAVAEGEALRADLYAERARICDALGRLPEARQLFAEALRLVPLHPASLRGLESVLRRELVKKPDAALSAQLAAHLERLAEAYAPAVHENVRGPGATARADGDVRLAAWIHVERAAVLDHDLGRADLARAALERAVAFEPAPGPVRDALNRHLVRHDAIEPLAESLAAEAGHETDDDRASRLLYTAARLLIDRLAPPGDARVSSPNEGAVELLVRASARAPQGTPTQRRVLGELIRLLEANGELERAAEVRQKLLPLVTEPEALAHEHVRLSEIFDALGRAAEAAHHAARALELDPDDVATRDRLDRALQRLGRHDERVRAWVAEANATRPTRVRVAALLRAADIAERHLRRRDEALAHLRAAWAVDPGNGSVFDALSTLLAPPPREVEGEGRGVRARLELYTQAAQATTDPARKVGMLEKLAQIWEDELGQPARAIEVLGSILAIEPGRRSAILALQRAAERAGDAKELARALEAEADITQDRALERRLCLRAAEVLDARVGDRDRAFALCDRALAVDPNHPDALRAKHRLLDKAGRHQEARRALLALIGREPDDGRRFALWIEVARLDEQRLRRTHDAVEAYTQAALIRPRHPLPPREIARLLRAQGDAKKLVAALMELAGAAPDAREYTRWLFQAAEVHEMMLRDDAAALKCLVQAAAAEPEGERDPAIVEAMERIHVRRRDAEARTALYAKWLEHTPPAAVDHGLRIALAEALAEQGSPHAVDLLEGLVGVVPSHVPALRMLEQLHRKLSAHAALATVIRAEADVFGSAIARAGALWEVVSLEEHLGPAATLDALGRIVADAPRDVAALDAIIRAAGRIVAGINVPHPAALAMRARLVAAVRSRREQAREPLARAFHQLEEALLVEAQAGEDPAGQRAALAAYGAAVALWPESVVAARAMERLADKLGDRASLVLSQVTLARLAPSPRDRAAHLVRAAALVVEDPQPKAQADALALYEEALRADADAVPAARALARLLAGDVQRLVDRLGEALERASANEAVTLLGTEIGRAILRARETARASLAKEGAPPNDGPDAGIGVQAMKRVLAVTPDDVPSLLLAARLLVAQRVWAEARDTLLRVADVAAPEDAESRIAAHFLLADIYEGPLKDLALAQNALKAVLAIDDKNRRALDRLYTVAAARGDRALAIQALGRLAEVAPDAASRVEVDLRLAEACREAGDQAGRIRALCDAVVTAPNDQRPWSMLARLYRVETQEGAGGYAAALQQLLDLAAARRAPVDHRWLTTLGMLEVTVLVRARDGVGHLMQAASAPGAPPEAKVALGRGLEIAGRNAESAQVLRDVLSIDGEVFARVGDLSAGLASLEAALAKEGRIEERLAVEEVRGCLGEVKPDRLARLRARRLPDGIPYPSALLGAELDHLLLPEARVPVLNVAASIAPVAAKILRFDLVSLGIGSRERIGPRDGHPTRMLADRMARALGVESFELYLSPSWQGAARIYPGDPPALVGSTSFADLPEQEQAFALARLLTRAALGPTWLDELAVDALDGLLLASVRAVEPAFGQGELSPAREGAVQTFLPAVQKALGRRQKKQLEEIAQTVTVTYDPRLFSIGIRRSEYRIAYVLSGDLVSAIDYLRRFDREIGRSADDPRVLLQHPVTNELLRYALTVEAYTERRRVGTVWSG